MKLNVMFIITAILLTIFGTATLLSPILPAADVIGPSAAFNAMLAGTGFLSLGVLAWLVRNAEASKTRDALVLVYTLMFALWTVVSIIGHFGPIGDLPTHNSPFSLVIPLIQALIAVGFFIAGKSSKSKGAS